MSRVINRTARSQNGKPSIGKDTANRRTDFNDWTEKPRTAKQVYTGLTRGTRCR